MRFGQLTINRLLDKALEVNLGNTITAKCKKCEFSQSITIGGTRSSFQTHSYWPIYCSHCEDIISTNIRNIPLKCDDCNSTDVTKYDATHLVKGGTSEVSRAWDDILTDGDYFCPKCKEFSVKFIRLSGIYFD